MGVRKIWIIFLVFAFSITVNAGNEPEELYARSAVIMDADSGRVLFEKNGYEQRAMASTTKIMTCILALENGNMEDIVTASKEAAGQPKVHLGVREGEQIHMRDLLYSLMLESHNDSAVMIAEQVGGTVAGFADLMNEKAREIGCQNTYFITPNGLDAADEGGIHSTTAEDLARIMSYCITKSPKKEEFLKITRQPAYEFSNIDKKCTYMCNNHNAFLQMMDGAISGKTGFTADAGYCYVGALKRDGRTFVVALLGCGWPNNKTYKWADTKKLMNYGLENYRYREIEEKKEFEPEIVENGIPMSEDLSEDAVVRFVLKDGGETGSRMLLKDEEEIRVETKLREDWKAPVEKGERAGIVTYYIGNQVMKEYEVVTANYVEKITMKWCLEKVIRLFAIA